MSIGKLKSIEELKQRIAAERDKKAAVQKATLTVSAGTCGQARGSLEVVDALEKVIGEKGLKDKISVIVTGCHGFCEAEPNIIIQPNNLFYQNVKPEDAEAIIEETMVGGNVIDRLLYREHDSGEVKQSGPEIGFYQKQKRLVLGENERIEPKSINDYFAVGGYSALAKALSDMSPEDTVNEIKNSGLRGRGGGGFPTGIKWQATRDARGDAKYVICNADEGDPGAYMDRSLMEGNPHRVLEGMIIGAYAIGAQEGYIYIRDEYPVALDHITKAIEDTTALGLLGDDILGSGFGFKVKISRGAGAFVCGEETALMASIEGGVGEPRQRPPFPSVRGLWKKPTNINNVETWGNIPLIINNGSQWFAGIGTENSKGTKIFSLVGKINNTGLVEVPMGITLREVIYDIGGGIPGGKKFKAVQTGGPSGGCLPEEKLDLPIDYQSLIQAGSIMGSGGMIVMDENTCMVDIAKYFLNFLRDESCGKCVSCREGTQRLWEIVNKITEGKGEMKDLDLLEELAEITKDASMCGLGQTAANPVLSTLKYFKEEYEEHILHKKCPALLCREIVSAPCQYICPIDQEASVYVALIAEGRYQEALDIIRKDNPLPSVCGRVCDHKCESVCRAGEIGEPISIRALKRFILDWSEKNKKAAAEQKKEPRKNKKVAIIGSGPAGLTAGYYLNLQGYDVTIFESHPVAGGMLAIGIPEHRLPRSILKSDIDYILKSGVSLKTNMALGRDFSLDDLFKDTFEAVFIAVGAHKSMKMEIPGEDAEGVFPGMEYLTQVNLGKKINLGQKVAIVGGGNAAIDAARVAMRNKDTTEVTILYRRTRKEMPAYEEEIEAALEEGIDIQFLVAPVRILTKNGKMTGVDCIRMKLGDMDSSGRRRPVPMEGSEYTIAVDALISAIGEKPDVSFADEKTGLKISRWQTIVADEETLVTNRKGVFTGGDAMTGPSSVVKAIGAGKNAAVSINLFLQDKPLAKQYELHRPSQFIPPIELTEEEVENALRPQMPRLSVEKRDKNFNEVDLGLDELMAVREARRCLRCELETEDGKAALGGKK
ncbi:MAG: FAD-dependent oxidoreductase [Acidobacteria bacterium]|nr:FAD-dependent oxidoreductase [Acidobacteriota bacterium]